MRPKIVDMVEDTYSIGSDGRKYLDFLSGGGAHFLYKHGDNFWMNFKDRNLNTMNFSENDEREILKDELKRLTNSANCLLLSSGSEANEAAIKLSFRYHNKNKVARSKILYSTGCYFGRTLGATYCSQVNYQKYLPINNIFVPFEFNNYDDFKSKLNKDVSGIILEYIPSRLLSHWDKDIIQKIFSDCANNDTNVIMDEIKTNTRTGRLFAFKYWLKDLGIKPDIFTFSKAIYCGFPGSGVLSNAKFIGLTDYEWYSTTTGGMPLACKIANNRLKLLTDENLAKIRNFGDSIVKEIGKFFKGKIVYQGKYINIFVDNAKDKADKLQNLGVMTYNINNEVITLLPNFWVNENHLYEFVEKFQGVMK